MHNSAKDRVSIPIPPGVDSFEIYMEDGGNIIISPVHQKKRGKKSLASFKGILDGAFYKTYGKSSAQVIRESRNEDQ